MSDMIWFLVSQSPLSTCRAELAGVGVAGWRRGTPRKVFPCEPVWGLQVTSADLVWRQDCGEGPLPGRARPPRLTHPPGQWSRR